MKRYVRNPRFGTKILHNLHVQLIFPAFLIFDLNICKVSAYLRSLESESQIKGPLYRIVSVPYITVLIFGRAHVF